MFDGLGNRIDSRENDSESRTAVIRDGNGNATTLIYDERGNVTEERDALYDGPDVNNHEAMCESRVSLPHLTLCCYPDEGEPNPDLEALIIDRRGMITEREYDTRGNVLFIREYGDQDEPFAEPIETAFTYDAGNRVTSITNARNHTTRFDYDRKGNLETITNAAGESSSFTYDDRGRRETFTDFNGNTTTFEYENGDQPTKVIFADDTYQVFAYNQFGQVTLEEYYEADETIAERRETQYDASGRVLSEITGRVKEGDVVLFDVEEHPHTEVRKFYVGNQLRWEVIVHPESILPDVNPADASELIDDLIAAQQSRVTEFGYDDNDRLIKQTSYNFREEQRVADGPVERVSNDSVVYFRYDVNGNRVALMDPVGNITTWVYDRLNRVVEERDPFYWEAVRDNDASLAALSDLEFLNRIAPDNRNQESTIDPLYDDPRHELCYADTLEYDCVTLSFYDGEGNRTAKIDRNGRRIDYGYDFAGRLIRENWINADGADHDGTDKPTITFTYDPLGNMLTATDLNENGERNSSYLFVYDALNRLESVDNNRMT